MKSTTNIQKNAKKPTWVNIVAQYQQPHTGKSLFQVANTLIPYLILWYLMYRSLEVGYWLTLLLAIPTALFVVRLFVLQHDCGHGSFFKSQKANDRVGMLCSIFTFVPYHYWRRTHAIHHSATWLQGSVRPPPRAKPWSGTRWHCRCSSMYLRRSATSPRACQ